MAVIRSASSIGDRYLRVRFDRAARFSYKSTIRYDDFVFRMRLVPRILEYQWVPLTVEREPAEKRQLRKPTMYTAKRLRGAWLCLRWWVLPTALRTTRHGPTLSNKLDLRWNFLFRYVRRLRGRFGAAT